MKNTVKLIAFSMLTILAFSVLAGCSAGISGIGVDQETEDIVIGEWEKTIDVGAFGYSIGALTINWEFYSDGTCVKSTDLNQTSTWTVLDESHIKVISPLNFTEVMELQNIDGQWYLDDYTKVEQ